MPTHHATVEVLVHLAESMRRSLALVCDDDADVSHSQWVLGLDRVSSAVCDEYALRCRRAVVNICTAAKRCGLNDFTTLNDTLFSLIQDPTTKKKHWSEI